MISGLMDFEHYGVLTDEPLAAGRDRGHDRLRP